MCIRKASQEFVYRNTHEVYLSIFNGCLNDVACQFGLKSSALHNSLSQSHIYHHYTENIQSFIALLDDTEFSFLNSSVF
jgi:hypothetical protein